MMRITRLFLAAPLLLTAAAFAAEPTPVDIVKPKVEANSLRLALLGSVEAEQQAQLATEQSGRVERIAVEAGDRVKAGQVLLQLEDSLARYQAAESAARVELAKVAVAEAKRLLDEVESLSKRQVAAATLVEERKAQLASAKASLQQEQATLAYRQKLVEKHTLKAPFDGLVERRSVSLGEWLSPSSTPFSLIGEANYRVRFHLPQEYFFELKNNAQTQVSIQHDKLPNTLQGLRIDRLIGVSQAGSRSMPALINLPANSGLQPGMSANVLIALSQANNNRAWVPTTAIKIHPDGGHSLIGVEQGKAVRLQVRLIRSQGESSLVEGVPASAQIVANGVELIQAGASLSINSSAEYKQ